MGIEENENITFIRNKHDLIEKRLNSQENNKKIRNSSSFSNPMRKLFKTRFVFGCLFGYTSCYIYYKIKIEKLINNRNFMIEDDLKQLKLEIKEFRENE